MKFLYIIYGCNGVLTSLKTRLKTIYKLLIQLKKLNKKNLCKLHNIRKLHVTYV